MRLSFNILSVFLVIQLLSLNSYAQKLSDTLKIEEIRINSLRPLQENSLSISRLDTLVLQFNSGNSLSEVLAENTGIFIKSYGRGAMASASFRGTDPSHTKVLWNGLELNSPMLGMVDFSLIPMFCIDNVELLHGSSSISETSGALGGIINLSTEPDWKSRVSGAYMQGAGSFRTHDEQLRLNVGNDKLQSQTRIFYAHSDNDFSFENHDIIDSVNLETGKKYYPRMTNRDAWFSYYGILEELHYRPGKNKFFNLSFWGQESSRSIPMLSTSESGPNNNINRQNDNSIRAQVSYINYGEKYKLKVFSGINTMDLDFSLKNRLSDDSYLLAINSKSWTSSLFNKLVLEYILSQGLRLEFSTGLDVHKVESIEKVKILGYSESRTQAHISASVNQKWNERWTSKLWLGNEFVSAGKSYPVYLAGTEFHVLPDDKLYLKIILASNTRYPSLNDLYYQPGGNTGLKPERSKDQELGLHFNNHKGGFEFTQDFSLFMSQVKNWIMWYYTVRGFSPENIEKVDIKGFETNVSLGYTGNAISSRLTLGYTMTHSLDMGKTLSESDQSFGKQLPYIPVHSANVMLYLMRKNWSLTYIWNFYSRRYTTTSNEDFSQRDFLYPYFMNQIGLGKQLHVGDLILDMNVKILNLFNEEYRSILQRPMPGRNFSLQLKLTF